MRNTLSKLFFLLCFLVPIVAQAGQVTMQDTLRPTGNGSSKAWSMSGIGGSHWERIDEVTLNTGDYIYESTVGDKYSLVTMGTCPDDWVYIPNSDSVELVAVVYASDGTSGDNRLAMGRGHMVETVFQFCSGGADTFTIPFPAVWDTIKVMYLTDPCQSADWTAFFLNQDEWGFVPIELKTGGLPAVKQMRVAQAYIVAYWTFRDSAEFLTNSAVLCSTWGVSGCDDLVECLSSQACDDIRINTDDDIHAWLIEDYSNPAGTKIDSVENRLTGFVAVETADSITIAYIIESEGSCTEYGKDTIPDMYFPGNYNGEEKSKVWDVCPATGVAWTSSDLTDDNKGFGVTDLHNSYVAVSWFTTIVYYSEAEEEEEGIHDLQPLVSKGDLQKKVDKGELQKLVNGQ